MKSQNPSFPLMLVAGVIASACGGATEINYVEETGGSAGDGGSGGGSLGGTGGTGGSDASGGGGGSTNGGSGGGSSVNSGGAGGGTVNSGGTSSVDSGGTAGTGGGTSSVDSGGTAGSGGTGGDSGCLATGCPAGQYCDADTRECNSLKTAGETCDLSQQCQDLLDCVDGVCCTERECPACMNCGGDGACSVPVQDAEDVTGVECMEALSCDPEGVCRLVLGQSCYSNDECLSGSCLDGVCCGDSECPDCMNCGDDGSCSVPVQDADDMTSMCNGTYTCDLGAECTARWSWVTAIDVDEVYIPSYSTAVGSTLYFADAEGYHKGYDTSSGIVTDAPINSDYCWCGAGGIAVSDGYSMFYFGNDGRTWTPSMATAWSDVPDYSGSEFDDGEGTFAVADGRVYRISGRYHKDLLSYYDIETGTFVGGLAEHPVGGATERACGGGVNGRVYAFGWDGESVSEYDPDSNAWTVVDGDPNAPYGCYDRNLQAWGTSLVYADYQMIKVLDTSRLQWLEGGIPLPDTGNLTQYIAMVANDQLYAVGWEPTEKQIHIYQYTPPDTGVIVDP